MFNFIIIRFKQSCEVLDAMGLMPFLLFLIGVMAAIGLFVSEPSTHQIENAVMVPVIMFTVYALAFVSWMFVSPERAQEEIAEWAY